MSNFTFKDIKDYNDRNIINGVDEYVKLSNTLGFNEDTDCYRNIYSLWAFARKYIEKITEILEECPVHKRTCDAARALEYTTSTAAYLHDYVCSLPDEEQVTLTLMGLCI